MFKSLKKRNIPLLNVKNIKIIGNLKFIDSGDTENNKIDKKLFLQFKKYKLLLQQAHMIPKKYLRQKLIFY
jgi:hypothetical protein